MPCEAIVGLARELLAFEPERSLESMVDLSRPVRGQADLPVTDLALVVDRFGWITAPPRRQ